MLFRSHFRQLINKDLLFHEKEGRTVHVLNRDLLEEEVQMTLNPDFHKDYLQHHATALVLKGLFSRFYGVEAKNFTLTEDEAYMILSPINSLPLHWKKDIERMTQKVVETALPIRTYMTPRIPEQLKKLYPDAMVAAVPTTILLNTAGKYWA